MTRRGAFGRPFASRWMDVVPADNSGPGRGMRRTAPPSRPYRRYAVGLRPSLDPDACFDAPDQDKEARRTNRNNTEVGLDRPPPSGMCSLWRRVRRATAPMADAPSLVPADTGELTEGGHCSTCEEGAPLCGRPFLVEVVGQRPLPKVGVTEPTVACCWVSCTQSW